MSDSPYFQLYIDGAWCDGAAGQIMATQNPATGEDWATFACASPEDVDRAIAAAKRSLDDPAWRDMTQTQRGKLLYRLADLVARDAQKLGRLETTDSGKLLAETSAQTGYVADYYRYFAGLADKIAGAVLQTRHACVHASRTYRRCGRRRAVERANVFDGDKTGACSGRWMLCGAQSIRNCACAYARLCHIDRRSRISARCGVCHHR